jgi:hypothetical protein
MRFRFTMTAGAAVCGLVAAGAAVLPSAATPPAGTDLGACSPAVSLRGFSDALDKSTFDGQEVANLSGLATTRDGHVLAIADHPSTLYTMSVRTAPGRVTPTIDSQVQLADENGKVLDAEAVAVDSDGTRLVSSEIEPSVRRYSADGKILERLPIPPGFATTPAGRAQVNLSFEGLALLPGDRTLIATMEEPLQGDGTNLVRFVRWTKDRHGHFQLAGQYGFQVDAGLGISEAKAISPTRLLILERGYTSGYGNTVRLYLADLAGASNVADVADLPGDHTRLVRGTQLADLVNCPSGGATAKQPQPNPLLDNVEGMTLTGRHLPGGRQELLLVSDDNSGATQITRLYDLSVRLPLW